MPPPINPVGACPSAPPSSASRPPYRAAHFALTAGHRGDGGPAPFLGRLIPALHLQKVFSGSSLTGAAAHQRVARLSMSQAPLSSRQSSTANVPQPAPAPKKQSLRMAKAVTARRRYEQQRDVAKHRAILPKTSDSLPSDRSQARKPT